MPRMVRLRRKQSGCSDLGELASRCRAAALRLRLTLCAMARIRLARLWFFSGGKFRGQAIASDQRRGWKSEETERFAPAITQDTRVGETSCINLPCTTRSTPVAGIACWLGVLAVLT